MSSNRSRKTENLLRLSNSAVKQEHSDEPVSICRICMRTSAMNIPLLTITEDLRANIRIVLKRKILRKDPYQQICLICSDFLEMIVSFEEAARRTSQLLTKGTPLRFGNDEWYRLGEALTVCKNTVQAHLKYIIAATENNIELKPEKFSDHEQKEDYREDPCLDAKSIPVNSSIKEESLEHVTNNDSLINKGDLKSAKKITPPSEIGISTRASEQLCDDGDKDFCPSVKGKILTKEKRAKRELGAPRKKRRLKENLKFQPQLCALCGKRVCAAVVEAHMNQHRGVKPYRCPAPGCTLEFYGDYHRKRHIHRIHNEAGVTAHKCHICGKMIRGNRGVLTEHLRLHDLKERNFICTICGKGFTLNRYLRQHSMVHSIEFPHACSFCGKRFNNKWSMRTHEKLHQKHDSTSAQVADSDVSAIQNNDARWTSAENACESGC